MTSKTKQTIRTTSLSEAQLLLLSSASQRQDKAAARPESMNERTFVHAVNGLVKRGLLATAGDGSGKADRAGHGDGAALTITDSGLNAIGVTPEPEPGTEPDAAPQIAKGSSRRRKTLASQPQPEPVAAQTRPATKRAQIIALLSRRHGATLDDLIAATGWLPRTTRAALTGLRQSGLHLDRSRDEGRAVYRIVAGAETTLLRGRAA